MLECHRAPFGRRLGLDIDRQRDRLAHAEHGEVADDARRMGVELFGLRRGKAHRWKSFGVEQSPALHEIVEGRGTDVDRTGFDGKGRKAFCRPVEIKNDLSPIMGKVAACRREANGIDLESDPRLRLLDAPTLRPRRRLRACATKKRQRPNNDNPALCRIEIARCVLDGSPRAHGLHSITLVGTSRCN